MKRLDLLHGVIFLTFTLLSPIFLQIYGYLDVKTYNEIAHDNTFYRESIEPIRAYSYYRYFLLFIYFSLTVALIGLECEPTMRRVSRFQIQCYRPYYLYHCAVCLIPFAVRYANMTTNISDDIMVQMNWKQFFSVISSIVRFIFSFFLSEILRYKLWRVFLYILVTIVHAFVLTYLAYVLYIYCSELIGDLKRSKGEFVTTWSSQDHEKLDELSVNNITEYKKLYSLNTSLFLRTGQKQYQTMAISKLHNADSEGKFLPYHRKVLSVVNGESVNFHCAAIWTTLDSVNIMWSFNGSHINSKMDISDTKIIFKKDTQNHVITSNLKINFLENFGFGDYTCLARKYGYFGEKIYFENTKLNAMTYITSEEILIGQYSVRQYAKRDFYIYATPGGAIDLTWKSMNFDNDNEDIIQYYYVNGKPFEKQKSGNVTNFCSSFSYLYIFYAAAMNWFILPYSPISSDSIRKNLNSYETRFTECAGSSVYGVHSVEYFRRIYDERSKAFVLREVLHPNTLYVLPDLPYFYKMDNVTKVKKTRMIENLQELELDYVWFENSHHCVLIVRIIFELVIVLSVFILLLISLLKLWILYTRFAIQPLKSLTLGKPLNAAQSAVQKRKYSSYLFCGDADKESVYTNLVCPLRNDNISTGFSYEESDINKCGRSIFDIQCDILMQSDHLIFFITSSYLEEISFNDIHLETVLGCIKEDIVPANRVLFIMADNCELPEKLRYSFPEASSNIHDWVVSKDSKERYKRISEWIKKKKENKTSELVLSTIFVGQNVSSL